MKKGQTEIIGLLVIVILIIVVFLLYLRFSLIEREGLVTENIELSSMLNAILRYDTPEGSIKQIMIGCANGGFIGGEDTCVYLDRKIDLIMEKIVEVEDWNIKIFIGGTLQKQLGRDCSGSNLIANQNIGESGVDLTVRLEICKKL